MMDAKVVVSEVVMDGDRIRFVVSVTPSEPISEEIAAVLAGMHMIDEVFPGFVESMEARLGVDLVGDDDDATGVVG